MNKTPIALLLNKVNISLSEQYILNFDKGRADTRRSIFLRFVKWFLFILLLKKYVRKVDCMAYLNNLEYILSRYGNRFDDQYEALSDPYSKNKVIDLLAY